MRRAIILLFPVSTYTICREAAGYPTQFREVTRPIPVFLHAEKAVHWEITRSLAGAALLATLGACCFAKSNESA